MPTLIKRPDERRSRSQSATRALDVLEFFGEIRRPFRAIELVNMLGMNRSTANQLLKTMVDSAHLLFDARNKTYMPSPRLAKFSTWLGDVYGTNDRLDELITDLQSRTGLFVTVSTPNDLFMQVMETRSPSGRLAQRGIRVAVFGSTIGSAYLSTLDPAEFARLADRARITDAALPAIREELEEIRRIGYVSKQSAGDAGWSMAMPIRDLRWGVSTVLGLSGPIDAVRDRAEELFAIMQDAMQRHLGGNEARF
ncbi:MAG TPA: helix-turn-helix domain-containing protein [Sphingobium sp.]|nr:helix-turn-helix domain-containing protein [Sphingobium sp.]